MMDARAAEETIRDLQEEVRKLLAENQQLKDRLKALGDRPSSPPDLYRGLTHTYEYGGLVRG